MASIELIDKYERGMDFDVTMYIVIIGSLLNLAISRTNIMFSVCMCARYQASPKDSHFKIVKRILRYLNGTFHHGIWYPKGSACSLVAFSDFDFVGCKADRKSTIGTCHLFGSCLVSWHNKKQHNVALSTAKTEYVATGSSCAQVLWLK
ncbi:uncharacterized mitochondrial protein AtMg00810-like [Lathyrus oleraceus]|uniref:uncharacterized mitochondrial protein AtMg00810-like n=1 Tax=Pisum sativum TaxID=3888 RepID=UPI0021D2CEEF|nr:uncharacterized mitochondrial protein AtMg00810-like [Pisum sativum]